MAFKMKYEIETKYIPSGTKRRSGTPMTGGKPSFGVVHDTGNPGSTATGNINYYINSRNDMSASAHTFVDDKHIIECIPMTTGKPEKAWHVLYDRPLDNQLFGDDANDIAVGTELCFGGAINFDEAYKRYIWYNAYCAYKFGFSPTRFIGHEKLDPGRKTDPSNALKRYGKTYAQLLSDIVKEYNECTANKTETGWVSKDGKWYFYGKKGWLQYKEHWYFIKDNNEMALGWIKDKDKWFYLDKEGIMITGWLNDGGKWYYLKDSGEMQVGWLKVNEKWYYLLPSGVMVTGWQFIEGKWFFFSLNGDMAENVDVAVHTIKVNADGSISAIQ